MKRLLEYKAKKQILKKDQTSSIKQEHTPGSTAVVGNDSLSILDNVEVNEEKEWVQIERDIDLAISLSHKLQDITLNTNSNDLVDETARSGSLLVKS